MLCLFRETGFGTIKLLAKSSYWVWAITVIASNEGSWYLVLSSGL